MTELINFKTSKLAKEKKFVSNWKLIQVSYNNDGELIGDDTNEYDAPTRVELQMWLREKHNIHIIIKPWTGDIKSEICFTADVTIFNSNIYRKCARHKVYNDAWDEGLINALKLIQ